MALSDVPYAEEQKAELRKHLLRVFPDEQALIQALRLIQFPEVDWTNKIKVGSRAAEMDALIAYCEARACSRLLAFLTCSHAVMDDLRRTMQTQLLSPYEIAGIELLQTLIDVQVQKEWLIESFQEISCSLADLPALAEGSTKPLIVYWVMLIAESSTGSCLAKFVGRLIGHPLMPPSIVTSLGATWASLKSQLQLTDFEIVPPRPRTDAEFVQVRVVSSKSPLGVPGWILTSQLWRPEGVRPIRVESVSTPTPLSEIPDYFAEILRWLEANHVEFGRVRFEIFLERSDLVRDVDQWNVCLGEIAIPSELGYEFPVAIRFVGDVPRRSEFVKKRHAAGASTAPLVMEVDCCCADHQGDLKSLYRQFQSSEQIKCLILKLPLNTEANPDDCPPLIAALLVGIPVIVWGRDETASRTLSHKAHELFCKPLHKLPEIVHQFRRLQPPHELSCLSQHLTLFYEDSERWLPDPKRHEATRS